MTSSDESNCVIQPNPDFLVLHDQEEAELQKMIRVHNNTISSVVDDFSLSMEEFKSGLAQEKVNSKKRKLQS